jgi:hypothetical protein
MKVLSHSIILIGLTVYWFNGLITPVSALYDPRILPTNKAGVHILNPSEIAEAAHLVNSNGGDWGYVIVPIQPSDRDKVKWNTFMADTRSLHLIPIIRITTIPDGGTWATAHDTDLVDFANFLGELDWPVENRYIVLFNEDNRSTEWGDKVDPAKYALIVKNAYNIFKERSSDFFILGPSLDAALPNSVTSLSATNYLNQMAKADPLIWSYFDGWSSHSYPNPGFMAPASKTGMQSIVGYKSEISSLKLAPKPVFITETGWDQTKIKDSTLASYWSAAWQIWLKDPDVVAVTPFLLQGGEQFTQFSLLQSGDYGASGQSFFNLPKTVGSPKLAEIKEKSPKVSEGVQPKWVLPFFKNSRALTKLENIFRVVLGLPTKTSITLKDIALVVETAETPKQWEHGLSDRTSLEDMEGMLFIFPQYHIPVFWMKDMHFAVDMIWLSDGQVVDITPNAPIETSDKLPTYSPKSPVNMVLETRALWAEENGIALGDILTISDN